MATKTKTSKKAAIKKVAAKKTVNKKTTVKKVLTPFQRLQKELINAFKPVFANYPELQELPVYSWGRYFKYELAGDPFQTDYQWIDELFESLAHDCNHCNYNYFTYKELTLLEKIDSEVFAEGGLLDTNKFRNLKISRSLVANKYCFDKRGGNCLVLKRNGNRYTIDCLDCDSPE